MSNRKLTKFPVIAEDGTEYRVKINEWPGDWAPDYVVCRLYVPRKWFGYRRVFGLHYSTGDGVYDAINPDFIAIARRVYADWLSAIDVKLANNRAAVAQAQRKSAAIDAFQSWDGRL
ncbi:hypothetical protein MHB71_04755 [Paenibacillus sp. FSL H7-0940]|uniref:hypothetical protein n=1 Tax=Paenibacillus sp. FSL H7-0940 TaxID=2921443 RepID=UPI0030EDD288